MAGRPVRCPDGCAGVGCQPIAKTAEGAQEAEQAAVKEGMLALLHDRIYGSYAEKSADCKFALSNFNINILFAPYMGQKGMVIMNDFMTWQTLATFAGCSAAVAVITQFIKGAGALKKIPTQWVSYILAAVLLLGATYFTGVLTGPTAALIPFNAVVVSLAANGAYSAIQRASGSNAATIVPNGNESMKIVDSAGNTLRMLGSDGAKTEDGKLDTEVAKPAEMATQPLKTVSSSEADKKVSS